MIRILTATAAAIAIVAVCSVDAAAQQHQHGQHRGQHYQQGQHRQVVINRSTVITNTSVYNGRGRGYQHGYHNGGVGRWPGSGPYDSAIAVAGIVAGASVLNSVIASSRPQPVIVQQPVYQAPAPVYQAPVYQAPMHQSGPGCVLAVAGYSPEGAPIYYRYCR